jgi:hypothetical protein
MEDYWNRNLTSEEINSFGGGKPFDIIMIQWINSTKKIDSQKNFQKHLSKISKKYGFNIGNICKLAIYYCDFLDDFGKQLCHNFAGEQLMNLEGELNKDNNLILAKKRTRRGETIFYAIGGLQDSLGFSFNSERVLRLIYLQKFMEEEDVFRLATINKQMFNFPYETLREFTLSKDSL